MRVNQEHLTGSISDFPLQVVQSMLYEQVSQGNPADPSVFARCAKANKNDGGFNWDESVLGGLFWGDVITLKRFDLFPNIGNLKGYTQTNEEIVNETIKPKRKIIQISESVSSDKWCENPWNLTALCDDGTVWIINSSDDGWVQLPDIPQDIG